MKRAFDKQREEKHQKGRVSEKRIREQRESSEKKPRESGDEFKRVKMQIAVLLKEVRNVVPRVEKQRLYRGRGGEAMRGACCRLVQCLAAAAHPCSDRLLLRLLQTTDECLKHPKPDIQTSAARALRALLHRYLRHDRDAQVAAAYDKLERGLNHAPATIKMFY